MTEEIYAFPHKKVLHYTSSTVRGGSFDEPSVAEAVFTETEGMTLRDYFAAKAVQNHPHNLYEFENIAEYAYCLADAMLKARDNK